MYDNARLYAAYGSNLNLEQMEKRCPAAVAVGTAALTDRRLIFRGSSTHAVATVEPFVGSYVPVLIWKLLPEDEAELDRYESYPYLYRKEMIRVDLDGTALSAMIYIMNEDGNPYGLPSTYYLNIIHEGYQSAGFDPHILNTAISNSFELMYERYGRRRFDGDQV